MNDVRIPHAYFVNIDPNPGSHHWLLELRRKDTHELHDSLLVWKSPFLLRWRIKRAMYKMLLRQRFIDDIVTYSPPMETPSCPESKTENSPKPISDAT